MIRQFGQTDFFNRIGRFLPVAKGCFQTGQSWQPENALGCEKKPGTVLKTALLREICRRLVDQQTK